MVRTGGSYKSEVFPLIGRSQSPHRCPVVYFGYTITEAELKRLQSGTVTDLRVAGVRDRLLSARQLGFVK